HFRGRVAEQQILRDYVGVLPPGSVFEGWKRRIRKILSFHEKPPQLIHGPGGIGKSTLVAKFILDHAELDEAARFPFVYLDFDRPGLRAERPETLLFEAVRQLAVQYPGSADLLNETLDRWRERMMPNPEASRAPAPMSSDDARETTAEQVGE